MKTVFKFGGIFAIFISFSLFGVLKAYGKRAYISRLKKIKAALLLADDMLRGGADNREQILKKSFARVVGFYINESGAGIADKALTGDLRECVDAFFMEFGGGNSVLEHQRIKRVCDKLLHAIENEEKDYAAYAKIWQTAGVCAGLGVSIMLI